MSKDWILPPDEILAAASLSREEGEAIGVSREGRAVRAMVLGEGPLRVSLIGGCHADEPVGPWMLRRLAAWLRARGPGDPLVTHVRWVIVPHANPDGEAVNDAWALRNGRLPALKDGFDLPDYLQCVRREAPGEDMEFGFPRGPGDADARPENRAVAGLLRAQGPFDLHATLHGMGFAGGPWFLIDRAWTDRTAALRGVLAARVEEMGYRLHDVQRHGEKGFTRIARGFATRPDSESMRAFFLERKNPSMAAKFRPSSMEFVRGLGGDALTLVSEMPLFIVPGMGEAIEPADAAAAEFRDELLPALQLEAARDTPEAFENVRAKAQAAGLRAMPLRDQMRLQLAFIQEGLRAATGP